MGVLAAHVIAPKVSWSPIQACPSQSGGKGSKPLGVVTVFSVFQSIQGKPMAKPFLAFLLRGYTIAIITPISQARTCDLVRAPCLTPTCLQVLQNSGSQMFMLIV